ncbi:MAG: hypothetical protein ACMX3H_09560 [Sodalis sp. (in: enterobacteria)]|uniref:hypothetical protein n=1 Tax=Sodalis sp. (in: enterobacteria) TaxID=1898979 RepID=UPI0039E2AA7A
MREDDADSLLWPGDSGWLSDSIGASESVESLLAAMPPRPPLAPLSPSLPLTSPLSAIASLPPREDA